MDPIVLTKGFSDNTVGWDELDSAPGSDRDPLPLPTFTAPVDQRSAIGEQVVLDQRASKWVGFQLCGVTNAKKVADQPCIVEVQS